MIATEDSTELSTRDRRLEARARLLTGVSLLSIVGSGVLFWRSSVLSRVDASEVITIADRVGENRISLNCVGDRTSFSLSNQSGRMGVHAGAGTTLNEFWLAKPDQGVVAWARAAPEE